MSEYGVQAANFRPAIHVGRLSKGRTEFLDKTEATDMVLAAVAQYVERNFGGGMVCDFPGLGLVLDVRVRPAADHPPHDAEMAAARDADRVARVADGGGL